MQQIASQLKKIKNQENIQKTTSLMLTFQKIRFKHPTKIRKEEWLIFKSSNLIKKCIYISMPRIGNVMPLINKVTKVLSFYKQTN